MAEKYILTLDIGTTTIRSFIYNSKAETVGSAVDQVKLHYPSPGFVEIDPDELWASIVQVVLTSLKDADLTVAQVTAMGIATQRSTFITWSRETGKPFHRFITWKDLRADKLVNQWNESYLWKLFRAGAYCLYLIMRSQKFRAGSVLKFMNTQTTLRLTWALQNIAPLQEAVKKNDVMFGTMDAWLLHKLTGGKVHMTDVSSASATGFFDPFCMEWGGWALSLFKFPRSMLPSIVDTAGKHFGETTPDVWGHAIPIISCMADQTASMWGSCCFDVGDVKLTMGTGTFFNINTGSVPHANVAGLYPIVGWRLGDELVYSAEGSNNDTASIIKWAQNLGLFNNPQESASIAESVPDSDGVYFIPAFSGLGAPYNDGSAASGFVGMKPSTTKAHLVRAVLESLAFRIAQLYHCVREENSYAFNIIRPRPLAVNALMYYTKTWYLRNVIVCFFININCVSLYRVDGGVSNNDFIAQLVADLTGLRVERPVHTEMSSLGCAHVVGLQLGIWKSKAELKSLRQVACVFNPRAHVKKSYDVTMSRWEDAVKRMCGWYTANKSSQSLTTVSDSNSNPITPQNSFKVTSRKKNAAQTGEKLSKRVLITEHKRLEDLDAKRQPQTQPMPSYQYHYTYNSMGNYTMLHK